MSDLLHALGFIVIFGVIFMSVIVAEYIYWARKGRHDVYSIKESITNIATGAMYKVFDGIAIALFIQFFYDYVKQFGLNLNPELSALNILLLIVCVDFFFYFYHLAMHKVRWFWSIHVTHHSSKRMNFSTALRQNFLMDVNFGWVLWWMPLALIGFEKQWTLIAIEASLAYQFFLHTQAVGSLGWFEKVFNTPSHHRVHHGCEKTQIDRNFGGVLIIWDKLFGTFAPETAAGQIRYGINVRQPNTLNPIRLNLDEFIQMFKDVWHYRDFKIFYKQPDYVESNYSVSNAQQSTVNQHSHSDTKPVSNHLEEKGSAV